MTQRASAPLDERLLTHHPAGQQCLEVCASNGWVLDSGDVLRLVKLWSDVREGRRTEASLSLAHLNYARWLYQHGRIGEGIEGEAGQGDALDAAA